MRQSRFSEGVVSHEGVVSQTCWHSTNKECRTNSRTDP